MNNFDRTNKAAKDRIIAYILRQVGRDKKASAATRLKAAEYLMILSGHLQANEKGKAPEFTDEFMDRFLKDPEGETKCQ